MSANHGGQILIKLPILLFVTDERTFCKAATVERAEIEMEAIDVRNGLWRAYDSDGVQLNIVITKAPRAGRWGPEVERALIEESKVIEESIVIDDLRDCLKEMGAGGAELDSYSVAQLLPLVPEV